MPFYTIVLSRKVKETYYINCKNEQEARALASSEHPKDKPDTRKNYPAVIESVELLPLGE